MLKRIVGALVLIFVVESPALAKHCTLVGQRGWISYYDCSPAAYTPSAVVSRRDVQRERWSPPPLPRPAWNSTPQHPSSFAVFARSMAERHRVDPQLVEAVIAVESGWNPRARSPKGAQGIMQLMPKTAASYGVANPFDPAENIRGGVEHLADLVREFRDLRLALAAYSAGADAVRRYGGVPPYPETQAYVPKVLAAYERLRRIAQER